MRKLFYFFALSALIFISANDLFAGSVDYLSNQSAKYIMDTARNAATDAADIVAYNPAGTALMGPGWYFDLSNQTLFKYFKDDISGTPTALLGGNHSYKQSEADPILPNFYAIYNAGQIGIGKLAGYLQAGVVAGGGKVTWDGTTLTDSIMLTAAAAEVSAVTSRNLSVMASSVYYDIGAGAAYSLLDDMIGVSVGLKYVIARRSAQILGTFALANGDSFNINDHYEYDAEGVTGVFGVDAKPVKNLTIGVTYQTETSLNFKYTQKELSVTDTASIGALEAGISGAIAAPTTKVHDNLPQILSVGAEYMVMPALTVGVSSNIYFLSDADMNGNEKFYDTGWEIGFGAIYKVIDPLKIGASVLYTDQGAKSSLYTDEAEFNSVNPVLNSWSFSLGGIYTIIPNLDVTLASLWTHYLPKTTTSSVSSLTTNEKKDIFVLALGLSYKI